MIRPIVEMAIVFNTLRLCRVPRKPFIGIAIGLCFCFTYIVFRTGSVANVELSDSGSSNKAHSSALHENRELSKGFSQALQNVLMNGVRVPRGEKLDRYVDSRKGDVKAMVAAHLLSGDEHYWKALVDFYRKNPDPCVASYLALTAANVKDRLAFAEENVKLDPNNAISYLVLAAAQKGNGLDDSVKVALDQAKAAPACVTRSEWFLSALGTGLKDNGMDVATVVAAREHNPWDSKIVALLDMLVLQSRDADPSDVAASIRLLRSARDGLDENSWRTQHIGLDGNELALLSKLPDDWDYDGSQSVKERTATLSFERRSALARQSKAMEVLQNGSSNQVKEFYSIADTNGRENAITWLLGQSN